MTKSHYDPQYHHRRSIRLKGYDYAQAGAYFVTLCTQNRVCLFGDITDGEMRLNDAGQLVLTVWNELPVHYAGVDIDAFVIMPNHIHGIIVLSVGTVGAGPRACPQGRPRGGAPTMSLPDVVHRFKTLTTKRYTDGVKQSNWPPFPGKVWQRNYYERVIDEAELDRARRYIETNPAETQFATPLDAKSLRRQICSILYSLDHMPQSEAYWYVSEVVNQIRQLLMLAQGPNALAILEVVTEEYVERWGVLDNSGGEASAFFEDLADAWESAFLAPEEHQGWVQKLEAWQNKISDHGLGEVFETARDAARAG